jgi:hypothetical protein
MDNQLGGILQLQAVGQAAGFVIPSVEISMFLADAEDGHYDGKPTIPCFMRPFSNAALRQKLNVPEELTGVLVLHRRSWDDSEKSLLRGDVLNRIGNYQVDNDGNVRIERANLYVNHSFIVSRLVRNDTANVTVYRGGHLHTLEIAVVPSSQAGGDRGRSEFSGRLAA